MTTWHKWKMPAVLGLLVASPLAMAQDATEDGAALPGSEEAETTPAALPDAGDDLEARQAEFDRELLTVEEEVNSLKERVFRSKATLQLLAEIVAQGTGTGSRATITHVNNLGRAYKVRSLSYYLDGQARYSSSSTDSNEDQVVVFDGPLSPGTHKLAVTMQLQGSGGVFSYVDDIDFTLQSNASVEIEDGSDCDVEVVADEKGGMSRSFTERPDITFDVRCNRIMEDAGGE